MCGIAGGVGLNVAEATRRMLGTMRHRGPDDHGLFSEENVALGMTRLSILDLSPLGHQPMQSHCGRYWIVYNGECYNFKDIRRKLEALGDKFVSNSDTEVVLQAYCRWGTDCLGEMNGMFAFAIWDTVKKEFLAARDRMGIKPFYFFNDKSKFIFGSEIKAMLASGYIEWNINAKSISQYFTFGYIQQPATILEQVQALMPGHYLIWRKGDLAITRYWDCDNIDVNRKISYQDATEQLLEKVRKSVQMQMISDRPLGLFLSGGLDSAAVLASMSYHGAKVNTFSIGFEGNHYVKNEAREASELASHFGAMHEQLVLELDSVQNELLQFFTALDQPSVDGLNTYLVSKYASRSMTVALSGLGGDELFAGYSKHALLLWKSQHRKWQMLSRLIPLKHMYRLNAKWVDLAWRMRAYGESDDFLLNYTISRTMDFPNGTGVHSNDLNRKSFLRIYKETFRHLDTAYHDDDDILRRILRMDIYAFMSSLLLRDMDATAMAHSLEVRFPLIDHELAQFAFSLPDNYKLDLKEGSRPVGEGSLSYRQSGAKKVLLRAFIPLLPKGFADRQKNGFKLPVNYWLRKMKRDQLKDFIFDRKEVWQDYVAVEHAKKIHDTFLKKETNDTRFWKFFCFVGTLSALKESFAVRKVQPYRANYQEK